MTSSASFSDKSFITAFSRSLNWDIKTGSSAEVDDSSVDVFRNPYMVYQPEPAEYGAEEAEEHEEQASEDVVPHWASLSTAELVREFVPSNLGRKSAEPGSNSSFDASFYKGLVSELFSEYMKVEFERRRGRPFDERKDGTFAFFGVETSGKDIEEWLNGVEGRKAVKRRGWGKVNR
ncbi:hypothetical protein FT663_04832 [Candidozyma haemuli var. vulneris]|uniref:Uncharacterized protein n=1 Tax=Candidozyma haemuli TaxID=45357 RepID=A0A2V1B0L5_9ASCO|nr:hypothetical protein CXQ85_003739 [[Candida] haemuloni]KAF3985855.1 hypothetical protein FT662_04908 [[Candida] haemuloni var. vulneris]KAF3986562.1 hypothetical protein FT663_04832 [[Candida] haemuloni var. vulneris]PVH23449.1 hypothetical protein CXQ85_003739 [[Candida] haemuloni]